MKQIENQPKEKKNKRPPREPTTKINEKHTRNYGDRYYHYQKISHLSDHPAKTTETKRHH